MGELITGQAATYVEELWVETEKRYEIMCITHDVQKVVSESGIRDMTKTFQENSEQEGENFSSFEWSKTPLQQKRRLIALTRTRIDYERFDNQQNASIV